MTRTQLADGLAARAGIGPDAARAALDALFGTVRAPGILTEMLRAGVRVQLAGFGTFETRTRRARAGFDPRTRTRIVIPAGRTPAFRAATFLRSAVHAAAADETSGDKKETTPAR